MQHLLTEILTGLLVAVFTAFALRPASRDPFYSGLILSFAWPMQLFAWMATLMFLGCALGVVIWPPARASATGIAALAALFGSFALLGGFLIMQSRDRIVMDDAGLTKFSLWCLPRTIEWAQVDRVSFTPVADWFVVRGRDGSKIRISRYMSGIGDFRNQVIARLPQLTYLRASAQFGMPSRSSH